MADAERPGEGGSQGGPAYRHEPDLAADPDLRRDRSAVRGIRRPSLNRTVLWRQRTVLALTGALAVAAAATMALLGSSDADRPAAAAEPSLSMPGQGVDEVELWRSGAERDIRELAVRSGEIDNSLEILGEKLRSLTDSFTKQLTRQREDDFEREIVRLSAGGNPAGQERRSPISAARPATLAQVPVALGDPPLRIRLVRLTDPRSAGIVPGDGIVPVVGRTGEAAPPSAAQVGLSANYSGDPSARGFPNGTRDAASRRAPDADPASAGRGYLPGGSFMRAVILGGIDAPTSGAAQDNPHPVLLRVSGRARLPGLLTRDLRECLVLAAGYGDISSERALLRTESMSCLRTDGTFFDAQIRGFVVGEDGRAGVRGRLVSQRGEQLSRALLAGTAAGIGNVFAISAGASANRVDTNGLLRGIEIGDLATSGVAGGFSSALDRLAQYYIKMADQLHPVVEVGAGRTVDIVLQQGVDFNPANDPAG